jgi:hypothetical protein
VIAFGGTESHSNYYVIIYGAIMQMAARYKMGVYMTDISCGLIETGSNWGGNCIIIRYTLIKNIIDDRLINVRRMTN